MPTDEFIATRNIEQAYDALVFDDHKLEVNGKNKNQRSGWAKLVEQASPRNSQDFQEFIDFLLQSKSYSVCLKGLASNDWFEVL